jgi:hypothetical protein
MGWVPAGNGTWIPKDEEREQVARAHAIVDEVLGGQRIARRYVVKESGDAARGPVGALSLGGSARPGGDIVIRQVEAEEPMGAASFSVLDFAPDGAWIEECEPGAPGRFVVWCDGDILGTGETADEAVECARMTVRGWESSQ